MTIQEYRSLLGRLPIKSPTRKDIASLCPHLKPEEAVSALSAGHCVACPPLMVRGTSQMIYYRPEWVEDIRVGGKVVSRKNHPAELDRVPVLRMSLVCYPEAERAMAFAEANWGAELVSDNGWGSFLRICIQDALDPVNDRYHENSPRTKAVLYVALTYGRDDISNDWSQPKSVLTDNAIAQMTLDEMVWDELRGDQYYLTAYNCAHCGSAVGHGASFCAACSRKFPDDGVRCVTSTPLSQKMVAFLQKQGHVFTVDPEITWQKERTSFVEMICRQ